MATLIPKYTKVTTANRTIAEKFAEIISVKDFGATGDGTTDDTTAFQNAINFAATTTQNLYVPEGTYKISTTLNMVDKGVSLYGAGVNASILQAASGFNSTLINMLNTPSASGVTSEVIQDLTLSGAYGAASVGLDQAYTSRAIMRNVNVKGFNVGIRQVNNFTFYAEQVIAQDCQICWHLVGSNHNSEYMRCGAVAFGNSYGGVGKGLFIEYSGNDSQQNSLAFRGWDIEFGQGDGVVAGTTSTIIFDNCYMEEVGGAMFTNNDGNIIVSGGFYLIKDTTGFLVFPSAGGGKTYFTDKALISSDGSTRTYASIIKSSGSGSVVFESSTIFQNQLTTAGVFTATNLGKLGIPAPYLKPQGRLFSYFAYTGTATSATTNDAQTITCTASGNIGVSQQMSLQPFIGEQCLVVIKYASNTATSVTFVNAPGQTSPIASIGTLPDSAGNIYTAIFPVASITAATQDYIEFWKGAGWATNDHLKLYEVWLFDSAAIKNGSLALG